MSEKVRDVIIIGGGISSHTAALYTARANMKPLVISGVELDQLSTTSVIENFPGFPKGIDGAKLIDNCRKQAERFGAEYKGKNAFSITKKKGHFEVNCGSESYLGRSIIVATGSVSRTLDIPGEKKYWGRGVSTCSVCDSALYKDKVAVVVGGGDSAMEDSLALYKFAKKIYLVHRRDEFRASKIMQSRVLKLKDKIEVIYDSQVVEVLGDGKFVTGVKIKDLKTKEVKEIKCDGMFLAIGHIPNTKFIKGFLELDKEGYLSVDKRMRTSIDGVFGAGDCQDNIYRQAITAAGTGCQAALEAEKYIEDLKSRGKY